MSLFPVNIEVGPLLESVAWTPRASEGGRSRRRMLNPPEGSALVKGTFTSVDQLEEEIGIWTEGWNEDP